MKVIGLTGGIASGKSLILAMLKGAHIPIIDADDLARDVTKPHTAGHLAIVAHFGARVQDANGALDRKALARIIFDDNKERLALEAIVHPLIAEAMQERIKALEDEGHEFVVYCAPLLFEKGIEDRFSAVILVYCDERTQLHRLMSRDGLDEKSARLRLKAQLPLAQKRAKTPYQIDNSQSREQSAVQLSHIWKQITGRTLAFRT